MEIPVTNLRPALETARDACAAKLQAMFDRSWFILGPQVAEFEREFADAMGAQHAVGVGSGTAALELSLRDAGVSGDVLTSSLTAPFTAVAIRTAGATPRFADVDPETLLMAPNETRSMTVLPVHLYGQPCDVTRLGNVVVQDACQAHGATLGGVAFSRFSTYVAYSFYPTKNLGCLGDGGAVLTDDSDAAARLRVIRDGGRTPGTQIAGKGGINSRLDEMQACYLSAFLPHLPAWNAERAATADLYDQGLSDVSGVRLLKRSAGSVHHLYVIRADRRDELREHLAKRGIGTGIHYPVPLHLHPAFAGNGKKAGDLPNAERACSEIVSLPLWPGLPRESALQIVEEISCFYRR